MVRPIPPVAPVPKLWPNSTIVCVGTGPSLTQADVDFCRGKAPVIAVNDAYRLCPWADVLYAADSNWWRFYRGVPEFHGRKFSIMPDGHQVAQQEFADVQILRNTGEYGLELEPNALRTGFNSGYQAINLAVHLGATTIVLLGYDMQGQHFFGKHPAEFQQVSQFTIFLAAFQTLVEPLAAQGVRVVNATRITRLQAFPIATLEHALAPLEVACS